MPTVRLINTTTSLRVDDNLEGGFIRAVDPVFMAAIDRQTRHDHVDVQLVRRGPPHAEWDRVPDIDFLGMYFSHDRFTHQPMIKVFPERVLAACDPWRKRMEQAGCLLKFADRYPTLLYTVIIHELAHYLMDDRAFSDKYCGARSWTEHRIALDRDADNYKDPEWDNIPTADADREKWLRRKISSHIHVCDVKKKSLQDWSNANSSWLLPLNEKRKLVEESLANAFMLHQSFGDEHNAALRVFIDSQSKPYETGLKWHGNLGLLLEMAALWRGFKAKHIGPCGQAWPKATDSQKGWLDVLVKSLDSPGGVELPFFP